MHTKTRFSFKQNSMILPPNEEYAPHSPGFMFIYVFFFKKKQRTVFN